MNTHGKVSIYKNVERHRCMGRSISAVRNRTTCFSFLVTPMVATRVPKMCKPTAERTEKQSGGRRSAHAYKYFTTPCALGRRMAGSSSPGVYMSMSGMTTCDLVKGCMLALVLMICAKRQLHRHPVAAHGRELQMCIRSGVECAMVSGSRTAKKITCQSPVDIS